MDEKLLSIQEAAKKLKVSTKTLRRWENKGVLTPIRTEGGHRRYTQAQINDFIAKAKIKAPVVAPQPPVAPVFIAQSPVTAPLADTSPVEATPPQAPVNVSAQTPPQPPTPSTPIASNPKESVPTPVMRQQVDQKLTEKSDVTMGYHFPSHNRSKFFIGGSVAFAVIVFLFFVTAPSLQKAIRSAIAGYLNLQPNTPIDKSLFANNSKPIKGDITFEGNVFIKGKLKVDSTILAANYPPKTENHDTSSNNSSSEEGTELVVPIGSGLNLNGGILTNTDKGSDQKIFKTIKAGSTTTDATSNTDTFEFASGNGISLSLDNHNKKLTITNTGNSSSNSVTELISSANGSGSTSSFSGLEFVGSNNELGLLQGCSNGELLKWNSSTKEWECSTDLNGAGGSVTSVDGLVGALTISNTSGAGATITIDDASTTQKGIAQFNSTNFSASSGTINTIQNISTTSSPTFNNVTLSSLSTTGIVHNNASGVLSTSALNLAGGVTEITGTLPIGNGGTGTGSTPTNGQVLIGNGTGYSLATLTQGTGITVTNGIGTISIASTLGTSIDLTSEVTGLLPVGNGGTGTNSFTAGGILYGNTTSPVASSAQGVAGQVLLSGGSGAPTWTTGTLALGGNLITSGGSAVTFTSTGSTNVTLPTTGTLATLAGNEALTNKTVNGLTPTSQADGFTISGGTTSRTLTVTGNSLSLNQSLLTSSSPTFGGLTLTGFANCALETNGSGVTICGVGAGTDWTIANGSIYPVNNTLDFLIGSTATSTAKFAVLNVNGARGTQTASISGNIVLDNAASIQTTNNQNLTLGGNTTGNIAIATLSTGIVKANASGILSSAAVNLSTADITGTLGVGNGGTGIGSVGSAGSIAYSNGSSYAFSAVGTPGDCLLSAGSGSPTWGSCAGGGALSFGTTGGLLYPLDTTVDFAIGGTATTSAKFGVFGVGTDTPVASLSASTGYGLTLGYDGTIQTTKDQTLTLGGNTTGNITLSPLNGNGKVRSTGTIDIATGKTYQINGSDILSSTALGGSVVSSSLTSVGTITSGTWNGSTISSQFGGTGQNFAASTGVPTISSGTWSVSSQLSAQRGGTGIDGSGATNGQVLIGNGSGYSLSTLTQGSGISITNGAGSITINSTLGTSIDLASEITGTLGVGNGGTGTGSIGAAGTVAYSNGTTLAYTGVGSPGDCLISTGATTPTWGGCSGGGSSGWLTSAGLFYPADSTVDLAVGGTSTTSARFGIFGVNTDTPVASISASSGYGLSLSYDGSIQTTKNQSLTLGGNTTGNIILSPNGGNDQVISSGSINVASGKTYKINGVDVLSSSSLGTGITGSSLTSVGTITSGIWNASLIGTAYGGLGADVTAAGAGEILYSTGTNTYGHLAAGINGQCLTSSGAGAPVWGPCGLMTSSPFGESLGSIIPFNSTEDFLIGGQASTSAKFAVLGINEARGTQIASLSGSLVLDSLGSIQTTNKQTLTIGGSTTGAVAISGIGTGVVHSTNGVLSTAVVTNAELQNSSITVTGGTGLGVSGSPVSLGGTLTLSNTGVTSNVAGSGISVNQATGAVTITNTGVLSVVGGSGGTAQTGALTINNAQSSGGAITIDDATAIAKGIASFNSTNFSVSSGAVNTIQNITITSSPTFNGLTLSGLTLTGFANCTLKTDGSGITTCGTDSIGTNYWNQTNGVITPSNSTVDFLLGSQSTDSAKFAILNINGARGTQTATLSGNLTLDAASSIQTTNNQTLTLGGNSTGNITLSPNAGTGTVLAAGDLNLSNGKAYYINGTSVLSSNTLGTAVTASSLTSVGALSSGSIANGFGTILTSNTIQGSDITASGTTGFIASGVGADLTFNASGTHTISASSGTLELGALTLTGAISGNGQNITGLGTINGLAITANTGTITSGTWNGAVIGAAYGGTGIDGSSAGNGTVLIGNGSGYTLANLSAGSGINISNGPGSISISSTIVPNSKFTQNDSLGVLYPNNNTLDFLIGGTSTSAAKFAITGVNDARGQQTATLSGSLTLDASGSLQTTNNQTLTIGGNTTGNVILSPNNGTGTVTSTGDFNLASGKAFTINGTSVLNGTTLGTGITGSSLTSVGTITSGTWNGTAIAPQYGGTGQNFSGSTGVITVNSGTFAASAQLSTALGGLGANVTAAGAGELLYSTGTTTYGHLAAGVGGQCLTSGGAGAPVWAPCGTSSVTPFQELTGAIVPNNSTVDFLIGGQATTSAKFAVLGINGNRGTQIASISGNIVLDSAGSIQTTNNQDLTIGGNTTGNITLSPLGGSGVVNATGDFNLSNGKSFFINGVNVLSGSTLGSGITASSLTSVGTISTGIWNATAIGAQYGGTGINTSASTGVPTLSSGTWSVSAQLSTLRGGTGVDGSTAGNGTILIGNGSGYSLANITAGTGISISNGSGSITIAQNPSANPFASNLGAIYENNATQDFLIGSQSTSSAKFAILNVNGTRGTQTASVAGNLVLDAAGSLQTTLNQTLTIGGNTTGNILLSPNNGSGVTTSTGDFNLSSGKAFTINGTSVLSGSTLGSGVTASSLTSVGTITSGTWNGTAIGAQYGGTGINTNASTGVPTISGGTWSVSAQLSALRGGTGIDGSSAANGTVLIGNGSGYSLANLTAGNGVTITNGSGSITISQTPSANPFTSNLGAIYENNVTQDFLLGGTSTSSAKFEVLGINDARGTQTASLSGNLVLDSVGSLQTTNNQTLTIGGDTTGNIVLSPNNGSGTVRMTNFTTAGGLLYTNSSGILAQTGAGNTNQCLTSAGGGTPTWTSCTNASTSPFESANGIITQLMTTQDFLLGGTSTASAKFAILGINNARGTQTATLSGSLTLDAAGSLQTTNNQTLTIGGDTTGDINISPRNGSGIVTVNGTLAAKTSGGATIVVAASDSSAKGKLQADYVADGTDDDVTIETAIAALPSTGGSVVLLDGTYSIGDSAGDGIDLIKSNVSIIGSGRSTVLQRQGDTASNDGVITVGDNSTTVTGVVISDLAIDGQKGTYAGAENLGIYYKRNVYQSKIINSWIHDNDGNGVYLYGLGGPDSYNVISNNDIRNNDDYGVRIENTDANTISHNVIQANLTDGIIIQGSYTTVTSNLIYSNSADGIQIASSGTKNTISGNTIRGNSGVGVYVFPGNDNTITGNTITENTDGVRIDTSSDNIVSSNVITDNTQYGIILTSGAETIVSGNTVRSSGSHGIYVYNSSDNSTITNNFIEEVGASSDGILVAVVDNLLVSGNRIQDSGGSRYGINISDVNADNNYIGQNEITGTGFAQLVVNAGTGTTQQTRNQFAIEGASLGKSLLTLNQTNTNWNILAASSSGITRMILDSTGRLGLGTITPQALLHVNGGDYGGNALAIFNQTGTSTNDILAASSSGVTKFVIKNDGTASSSAGFTIDGIGQIQSTLGQTLTIGGGTSGNVIIGQSGKGITLPGFTGQNGILYATQTTGVLAQATTGSTGLCLLSGASAPTWSTCPAGSDFTQWELANGAIYSGNTTLDLLLGGTATTSAKFAILGINNARGQQTASVSGNFVLDAAGSLQTTNNQTLTLGGSTTGNIIIDSNSNLITANDAITLTNGTLNSSVASGGTAFTLDADNAFSTGNLFSLTENNGGTQHLTIDDAGNFNLNGTSATKDSGNTIYGSTAANGTLFLISTTNSTKGAVYFQSTSNYVDGSNNLQLAGDATFSGNNIGIGTTANSGSNLRFSGSSNIDVFSNVGTTLLTIENKGVGGPASTYIEGKLGVGTSTLTGIGNFVGGNTGGNAAFIINQTGASGNDIFAASTSGITKFVIKNDGTASSSAGFTIDGIGNIQSTNYQTLTLGGGSTGNLILGKSSQSITLPGFDCSGSGNGGKLTTTAGGVLTCASDTSGGAGGYSPFQESTSLGLNYQVNNTEDFLIGGVSTASAKFAILGVASARGSQVATLSGSLVLDAAGSLQTTNNQTLTIGGNTTGTINVDTSNTSAAINIGTTTSNTLNLGKLTTGTTSINGGNINLNGNTNVASGNTFTVVSGQAAITNANSGGLDTFRVNNHTSGGNIAVFQNAATNVFTIANGGGVTATNTLTISGTRLGGAAGLIVNQGGLSTSDIFAASASGTTKFVIKNDGTASSSAGFTIDGVGLLQSTNYQTLTLGGGSTGNLILGRSSQSITLPGFDCSGSGNGGKLTTTSGGVLTCASDTSGGAGGYSPFQESTSLGLNYQVNNTEDFLIGGVATTSAKFAILGVAGARGTQTASLSGNIVLDAAGSLQTTKNQTLTIGGNTTGDIQLLPSNGSGTVYIGSGNGGQTIRTGGNLSIVPSDNVGGFNYVDIGEQVGNSLNGATFWFKDVAVGEGLHLKTPSALTTGSWETDGGFVTAFNGDVGTILSVESQGSITQTAAYIGANIDLATQVTVPNSSSGNQTGISLTLEDGGTSATTKGLILADTGTTGIDYGIDFSGVGKFNIAGINLNSGGNGTAISATANAGGQAAFILNKTGSSGNIFTASASGVTKFNIGLDGTASSSAGFTIDGVGNIQSTRNQTLTLGGNTTGNIMLSPLNNQGGVAINKTLGPLASLDIKDLSSVASQGSEKISNSNDSTFASNTGNWTTSGTPDWAINVASSGQARKNAPGTGALTLSNSALDSAPVAGQTYRVIFDYTTTASSSGNLIPSFGGTNGVTVGTEASEFSTSQVQIITATNTNQLQFTPSINWYGTIDNVYVEQITTSSVALRVEASNGSTNPLEIRTGGDTLKSVFIGNGSGKSNTTGSLNVGVGYQALQSNTTGTFNTALGYKALINNTSAQGNTAVGYGTLFSNTIGDRNTALGSQALLNNTSGSYNTALGFNSLGSNTIGTDNISIGYNALSANTSGNFNISIGNSSLLSNSRGNYNAAIGYQALYNNTLSNNNVAYGYRAGFTNTVGGSNSFFGYLADVGLGNLINATAIGANSYVSANDSLVLGSIYGVNSATGSAKIGIGTTAPKFTLDINGGYGSNALLSLNQTNNNDILTASASGVTKFVIKNDGTASSSAGFTINGTGNIQSTNNQSLTIGGSTTGNILLSPQNGTGLLAAAALTSQFNSASSATIGSWTSTTTLPSTLTSGIGTAVANGYIYLIAGNLTSSSVTSNTYYARVNSNGTIGDWVSTTSYPNAQQNVSVVAYGGYLYAMGGSNAGGGTATKNVYSARILSDGSLGTWTQLYSLPVANGNSNGTVVVNNYVYYITSANTYYAKLLPGGQIGQWGSTTAAGGDSGGFVTGVINGKIYVIGGRNGGSDQASVKYTTPKSDGTLPTWNSSTNLPVNRNGSASVIANGYIYLLGGTDNLGSGTSNTVYYGKPDSYGNVSSWNTTTVIPSSLEMASAVYVNGNIYFLGGCSVDNGGNNVCSSGFSTSVYYSPVAKVQIAGDLDLLSLNGGNTASNSAGGGSIFAGNISGVGDLNIGGSSYFAGGVGIGGGFTALNGALVDTLGYGTSLIVNNSGTGDIFAASASGTTKFVIKNDGTASSSAGFTINGTGNIQSTNNQSLTIGGGSTGNLILGKTSQTITLPGFDCSGSGNGGKLTTTSGGVLTCAADNASAAGGYSPFQESTSLGLNYQVNNTEDFLIGGVATTSAKFAVLNVAGGTPTASVSAQNAGGQALILGSDGTIQTARNNSLVIGGNTTGSIQFKPNNNSVGLFMSGASVAIGNQLPQAALDVSSGSHLSALTAKISFGTTGGITGILGYDGGANDEIAIGSTSNHGLEFISNNTVRGYFSNSGLLGIGTTNPNASVDIRSEMDSSIGGTSAIASISGVTSNAALSVDNNGSGAIFAASSSGQNRFVIAQNGSVGINTSTPAEKLEVGGNIRIGAQSNSVSPISKLTQTIGGQISSGGTQLIASVSASAVYNGSLYVGTGRGSNTPSGGAEIYRYIGTTGNWELVSQGTPGQIANGGTTAIASISAMTVFNGSLYVGTFKTGGAEVYQYGGGTTWNRVSQTTAGTFGATASVDGITSMAVSQGSLYIGTAKLGSAQVFKYESNFGWQAMNTTAGRFDATNKRIDAIKAMASYNNTLYIGTQRGVQAEIYRQIGSPLATAYTLVSAAAGTICTTIPAGAGAANVAAIRSLLVYNGKLFLSTENPVGGTEVCRYEDNTGSAGTLSTIWTKVNPSQGLMRIGGTSGIRSSVLTVYNGRLYAGTEKPDAAELYEYRGGESWSVINPTAGTFATGGTSNIDKISSMIPYKDSLILGTGENTPGGITTNGGAEVYSYQSTVDQSYALQFRASSQNGEANGLPSIASMWYSASTSGALSSQTGSMGSFMFSAGLTTAAGSYDVAEDYPTRDTDLKPGDIVEVDPNEKGYVRRSSGAYAHGLLGVYSEKPGFRLSQTDDSIDGSPVVPIALAGRVPVRVSLENGPINPGDYLTSSSIPGVAMKATNSGNVIGKAMESYNNSGEGKILAYVNSSQIIGDTSNGIFAQSGMGNVGADLNSNFNTFLSVNGNFAGKIRENRAGGTTYTTASTGYAEWYKKSDQSDSLENGDIVCMTTSGVSKCDNNGTILGVVTDIPGFEGNAAHANDDGYVLVAISGQVATKIDTESNIKKSDAIGISETPGVGTKITSGYTLGTALEDASSSSNGAILVSVNPTYKADIAMGSSLNTLAVNNSSQTSTVPSSELKSLKSEINYIEQILSSHSENIIANQESMATLSARLDKLEKTHNLTLTPFASSSSEFATVAQDLVVFGNSSFNNASVQESLSIGNSMTISNGSINTIGTGLALQSLRQGDLDLMAGAVIITTDGTMHVKENAEFGKDVTVKGVLSAQSVNLQKGGYIELSATEASSSATAGSSTIRLGQTQRKIYNPNIKSDSLIYVTPTSRTGAMTPYISEQSENGKYFIVEIENTIQNELKFNYLIINRN